MHGLEKHAFRYLTYDDNLPRILLHKGINDLFYLSYTNLVERRRKRTQPFISIRGNADYEHLPACPYRALCQSNWQNSGACDHTNNAGS